MKINDFPSISVVGATGAVGKICLDISGGCEPYQYNISDSEGNNILNERCQKGYKTHPTRKTKKMFVRQYRNCIKAEDLNLTEEELDEKIGELMREMKIVDGELIDDAKKIN